MSGIEFDDNQTQNLYAQIAENNEATGLAKFLIEKGIAKDQSQANAVLTITMAVAFALTGFVVYTYLL